MQLFPGVEGLLDRLERSVIADDDLVRFREDDGDTEVATVIRSVATLADDERSEFRTRVSREATYTLQLFTRRRVVKGRKQPSRPIWRWWC